MTPIHPARGCSRRPNRISSLLIAWVWLALLLKPFLGSADAPAQFDAANKLYEQGDYTAAIDAYEALIQGDQTSAAVFFNLGNAYWRSRQIGRAILNYHLALRLSPRDPDIRANLQFARESLGPNSYPGRPFWQRMLNRLTLNEWTGLATLPFWCWLLLVATANVYPRFTSSLKTPRKIAGTLTLFSAITLAAAAGARYNGRIAVVVAEEAVVRAGPFEESQSLNSLRDGVEVILLRPKADWLEVRDAVNQMGWVQAEHMVALPPG